MKRFISIVLTLVLICSLMVTASAAYAVPSWAQDANESLGLSWDENPNREIEKGEFMFVFLRAIQASRARRGLNLLTGYSRLPFTDANELTPEEFEEARILVDLGVLNGYQNKMSLTNSLTRSQAAKVLYFFNEIFELEAFRRSPHFTDITNHWAEDFIISAYRCGFVNGKSSSCFDPEGTFTVAEALQVLYNIAEVSDISYADAACAMVETFEGCHSDLSTSYNSVLYLNPGETITFNLSNSEGIWTSNNPSAVTVTQKGLITAKSQGSAIITCGGFSVCINVGTVETYVSVGDTVTLSSVATSGWKSSNTKIATVNYSGEVTGVKKGNALITRGNTVSYNVCVVAETVIRLRVDESVKLGESAYGKWTSDDNEIATVSSNGLVTAKKAGTTKIYNKYASYLVSVDPISKVQLKVGDKITLPTGSWSSSASNVTVWAGELTATKEGEAILTSNSNSVIQISVGNKIQDDYHTISKAYTLEVGETMTLGSNRYDSSWVSSNENVVVVSYYGKITAKKVGTAYVKNENSSYYITVIVDQPESKPETFKLSADVGDKFVLGDGSYDTWTSSNASVATVTKYGVVTFINSGKVTISNSYAEYSFTVKASTEQSCAGVQINLDGYEPSTYANVWVGDTCKVIVMSSYKLKNVTFSNSKCTLAKDVTSLGNGEYTFTVDAKSAGSCIATLTFSDGKDVDFTFNIYN